MKSRLDYVMDCTSCSQPQLLISGEIKIMSHPFLHVAVCRECIEFAHSDLVPNDDEGYEIYCKWCMEVGLLVFCDKCKTPFCKDCIIRNFDESHYDDIVEQETWTCYICDPTPLTTNRALLNDVFLYQHSGEVTKTFEENCQKKFRGLQTTQSDREAIIRERIKLRRKTVLGSDQQDSEDSKDLQSEESEDEEEKLKKKKKLKKHLFNDSSDSDEEDRKTKALKRKASRKSSKKSEKSRKRSTSKTDGFRSKKKKLSHKKGESEKKKASHKKDGSKKKKRSREKDESEKSNDSSSSGIDLLEGEKSSEELSKENLKNSENLNKETQNNDPKQSKTTSEISKKVSDDTEEGNDALWDEDLTIEENVPVVDLGVLKSTFSSEESDEELMLKELKEKKKTVKVTKKATNEPKKNSEKDNKSKDKEDGKKDKDVLSESDDYVSLSEDDTPINERKSLTA